MLELLWAKLEWGWVASVVKGWFQRTLTGILSTITFRSFEFNEGSLYDTAVLLRVEVLARCCSGSVARAVLFTATVVVPVPGVGPEVTAGLTAGLTAEFDAEPDAPTPALKLAPVPLSAPSDGSSRPRSAL